MKSGMLFIISAPSGAGKTSLVTALLAQGSFKGVLRQVITYTTRLPRKGDINGRDYHFIQELEFLALIEKGFFAEWSVAYGTYYGTPVSIFKDLDQGQTLLIILDRVGAQKMLSVHPQAILIWIVPPSVETLKARLLARDTETEAQIQARIALARQEIEAESQAPQYHYHIVNETFEISLNSLAKLIGFALEIKK